MKKRYREIAVGSKRVNQGFAASLKSFDEEMFENGELSYTKAIPARTAEASGDVAQHLDIEIGEPVVKAGRLLEVMQADQNLAALLGIRADDPVYRFQSHAKTVLNRIAEYAVLNYRGASNCFEFDAPIC